MLVLWMGYGCISLSIGKKADGGSDCIWWGLVEAPVLINEVDLCFCGVHIIGRPIEGSKLVPVKEFLVSPRVKVLDRY